MVDTRARAASMIETMRSYYMFSQAHFKTNRKSLLSRPDDATLRARMVGTSILLGLVPRRRWSERGVRGDRSIVVVFRYVHDMWQDF